MRTERRARACALLMTGLLAAVHLGCASGPGGQNQQPITVRVEPANVSVPAGESQQFTATVTGTSNTAITWSVNEVLGGNDTVGTISASGLYTAPATLPSPNRVTVRATSVASASASDTSDVTVVNPIPALTAIHPTVAGVGTFTLTVAGSKFVNGAQIQFGAALLPTTFVSASRLTAVAQASAGGNVPVRVVNPAPGNSTSASMDLRIVSGDVMSARAAVRFLEQSTFGPTSELVTQLRQIGFTTFLNDQFNAPASTYDDPAADETAPTNLQKRFFTNALYGPDQLRQRVAFALHKIWVVSWVAINTPHAFAPYLRMHMDHAFTNYRTIMENVTLNPAMGQYQDVANNDKPNPALGISANENYARELLQLFTVGTNKLNQDGTVVLDSNGVPEAIFDPVNTVQNFARVLTGWTYPTAPGRTTRWPNPPYYYGQLQPIDSHHDTDAKTLLSDSVKTNLPAGQSARQDLTDALDNIFNHPNAPPWVSKLLIQQLVTSNPSPAYVRRVADAFVSGRAFSFGSGERGDMKAVLAAILLDPEARRGDDPATEDPVDGHLREPVLFMTAVLRALGAQSDGNALIARGRDMGQWLLYPPTVFSYFSPEYVIPGTNLLGPEFQIQTTATSLVRINAVNSLVFGSLGTGTTVDFTAWANLAAAGAPYTSLLDRLNELLLHGTMSASMRSSIVTALNAVPAGSNQNLQRARTAIYLVLSSSQYQVQR